MTQMLAAMTSVMTQTAMVEEITARRRHFYHPESSLRLCWASALGILAGVVMALLAYSVGYVMYKQQANSALRPGQVVGKIGTVVTAIPSHGLGEINIAVGGQMVQFTALTTDGSPISEGTMIVVLQDLGGKVTVRKSVPA